VPAERSVVFSSPRGGLVLSLDVREQRLDSRRASDGVVFLELNLGCDSQPQLARDTGTEMGCNTIEAVKRGLLLRIAAEHAHIYACVPQIGTDLGASYGNEADDARVLCRFCEEGCDLDADRFGDAVRSTSVTQTRRPLR
jgi:hypothetical protein